MDRSRLVLVVDLYVDHLLQNDQEDLPMLLHLEYLDVMLLMLLCRLQEEEVHRR